jgi:protein-S-isoprenylcysteine O-methyltransferase Ste14
VILRHLLAMLVLPTVVVIVVPWWLLRGQAPPSAVAAPQAGMMILPAIAGVLVFLLGFALFASCVWLFARVGRGTLAPWDPTTRLVVRGPYRRVRNPMISGVALMLTGEALLFRSGRVAVWLAAFVLINHVYFVAAEEPGLVRRFGAEYERYRAAVPRWLPRWRPWTHVDRGSSLT